MCAGRDAYTPCTTCQVFCALCVCVFLYTMQSLFTHVCIISVVIITSQVNYNNYCPYLYINFLLGFTGVCNEENNRNVKQNPSFGVTSPSSISYSSTNLDWTVYKVIGKFNKDRYNIIEKIKRKEKKQRISIKPRSLIIQCTPQNKRTNN